jgi:cbb3-type cytochrome oxidase subunit 3
MKTTMDLIKKNWITIAIAILVVAVIIYFMKKKKKTSVLNTASKMPVPDESKSGLQRQLSDCENNVKSIRLIPGSIHPCAGIRDAISKTSESSYNRNDDNNIGNEINVVDYAIGDQGMAMLTESSFAKNKLSINDPANDRRKVVVIISASEPDTIKLPGMDIKDTASSFKGKRYGSDPQHPISNYNGAFSSTNGLNVVDFASGLEGTSLLLDKNLSSQNNSSYIQGPRTIKPIVRVKF